MLFWDRKIIVLIIALILWCVETSADQVLRLNVTSKPPLHTADQKGFLDEVAQEIFKTIGYRLETVQLPAARGLTNANAGLEDGELVRVKGVDKLYSNLIRVPEKLIDMEFVVFSAQPIDLHQGWKSLDNKSVAFINGWNILEKNVPKTAEITRVKDPKKLFTLLKNKRTDYVIYVQYSGYYFINLMNIKNVELRSPPLARRELYMYLHKKHKSLIPRLATALADMKQDGRYQILFDKHLSSYIPKIQ